MLTPSFFPWVVCLSTVRVQGGVIFYCVNECLMCFEMKSGSGSPPSQFWQVWYLYSDSLHPYTLHRVCKQELNMIQALYMEYE